LKKLAGTFGAQDALLIGLDACQESDKVYRAYNDSEGVTHKFTLNCLAHANDLLGYQAFTCSDWDTIGEYDINDGAHRAFVLPKKDVVIDGVTIKQGEKIRIEESYKYSGIQADQLWRSSDVMEVAKWSNEADDYALHLLKPAVLELSNELKRESSTCFACVASRGHWRTLLGLRDYCYCFWFNGLSGTVRC